MSVTSTPHPPTTTTYSWWDTTTTTRRPWWDTTTTTWRPWWDTTTTTWSPWWDTTTTAKVEESCVPMPWAEPEGPDLDYDWPKCQPGKFTGIYYSGLMYNILPRKRIVQLAKVFVIMLKVDEQ